MNPCAEAASVQRLRGITPNRWVANRHFVSRCHHRVCIWNELTQLFTVFDHEDAQLWAYISENPHASVQALATAAGRSVREVAQWVSAHMHTHLLCDSDAPPPASRVAPVTSSRDTSADRGKAPSPSVPASASHTAEAVFKAWALKEGYRWSASWHLSETPTQNKKTLSDLKNQGVFQLRLEDRELELRPALFAALLEARQLGFSITIATHGRRLNSVDLELIIAAYPHCVEVGGPASGPCEEDPDAGHTIRYLSKAGVKVISTPTPAS